MFRKVALLGLPLIVIAGVVVTVVIFDRRRTPEWQMTLSNYLEQTEPSQIEFVVRENVEASMPWNFDASMGSAYRDPKGWQWQVEQLPFPPHELRCVLIRRLLTTESQVVAQPTRQVLYVARHSDMMWRMGWVVHEGPVESLHATTFNGLSSVGCSFESEVAREQ